MLRSDIFKQPRCIRYNHLLCTFFSTQFRVHWLESFCEGLQHLVHACIKPLKFTWSECCGKDLGGNLSYKKMSLINSVLDVSLSRKQSAPGSSDSLLSRQLAETLLVLRRCVICAMASPVLRAKTKIHFPTSIVGL